MRMMNEYVLVEPKRENVTKSGLIVPENVRNKYQKGVVFCDSKSLKAGEEVLYKNESFGFDEEISEIEVDGKKVLVLNEKQIVFSLSDAPEKNHSDLSSHSHYIDLSGIPAEAVESFISSFRERSKERQDMCKDPGYMDPCDYRKDRR